MQFRFKKGQQCYPKKICLVNQIDDHQISLAQEFDLPVVSLEANNNKATVLEPGTIYVISDFEHNQAVKEFKKSTDKWIIGPTMLQELITDDKLELKNRPTYCSSMYGLVFHVKCVGIDPAITVRIGELIKWMGGMFVREPNRHVTHMVSNSVRANGYTYCCTFRVPVVSLDWVEYCWQNRYIVGFRAADHAAKFKLQVFTNITFSFMGFNNREEQAMEDAATDYGGSVVPLNNPACTHMVLNQQNGEYGEFITGVSESVICLVPEWFWMCLEVGHRVTEEEYLVCIPARPLRQSLLMLDVPELNEAKYLEEDCTAEYTCCKAITTNGEENSTKRKESSIFHKRDMKKKYNFEELCLTEKNYVKNLETIVKVKQTAIDMAQPKGPVLSKAEARAVFGNVDKILEIHQNLVEQMENNMNEWDNDCTPTMEKYIMSQRDISREYEMYSKNVEECQQTCTEYLNENRRFQDIVSSCVPDKRALKELFILPFQRMCSVYLLLTEMKSNTREMSRDSESISEVIKMIKHTLDSMNESKTKSDNRKAIFYIFYNIENCPPSLISSHREFIVQFNARDVSKILGTRSATSIPLSFYLFNDVLEITKRRKANPRKKLYKHLVTLSLCMIVKILQFKEQPDQSNCFGFITRDITDENRTTICCFQYEEGSLKVNDVLVMIATQMSRRSCDNTAEDFIVKDIPANRLSVIQDEPPPRAATPRVLTCVDDNIFTRYNNNLLEQNITGLRKSVSCSKLDAI